MGHIITDLALHFRVLDPKLTKIERIEFSLINKQLLIRACNTLSFNLPQKLNYLQ